MLCIWGAAPGPSNCPAGQGRQRSEVGGAGTRERMTRCISFALPGASGFFHSTGLSAAGWLGGRWFPNIRSSLAFSEQQMLGFRLGSAERLLNTCRAKALLMRLQWIHWGPFSCHREVGSRLCYLPISAGDLTPGLSLRAAGCQPCLPASSFPSLPVPAGFWGPAQGSGQGPSTGVAGILLSVPRKPYLSISAGGDGHRAVRALRIPQPPSTAFARRLQP